MKLNYKRTFFVGLAFLSISAFWQLYENIIPLILKNTFQFKDTAIGGIMALDNVVALFLIPIFGALSDRTRTRIGKRMPYILIGTFISAAVMIILPMADYYECLWLFLISLGIVLLSMGTYRAPAVSLMPDVTIQEARSQANAVINLMGATGGILTLILIKVLVHESEGGRTNYIPIFSFIACVMIVAVIILFTKIKENEMNCEKPSERKEKEVVSVNGAKMDPQVKKSFLFLLSSIFLWFTAYNAVTSAFSRYVQEVWHLGNTGFTNFLMVAVAAAILSYIPIGAISARIGRKKTILIGIIMITISYALGCLFVSYHPLIYLVFIMTGFGWAAINVNSYPMVVDMSKGTNIGKYTGYYYTVSMTAQIITPILSGVLLEHVSYYALFPYAVFFSVLSGITILKVKHGDTRPLKKKSVLENFDVED